MSLHVCNMYLATWRKHTKSFTRLQYTHRPCACNIPISCGIEPQHAPEDQNGINISDGFRNIVNILPLPMLDSD